MTCKLQPLAITMGDPAGCGPQITCDAWQTLRHTTGRSFFIIAPIKLYSPHVPVAAITSPAEAINYFGDALPILPLEEAVPNIIAGEPDIAAAPAILASITKAVAYCQSGEAGGLVTNPINKALLYQAGFNHPGHTEYLAQLCQSPNDGDETTPVMMLVGGGLRVALATVHLPLKKAISSISVKLLIRIARIMHTALKQDFGFESPRIAFSGLNPHAGEGGALGKEEVDIINPAAELLRAEGINISDARPADTVFHEALSGIYDAVIAMTHDQGLIPVKTVDFWGGVNTTLGLPIIRTSPDHGTAYDAAKTGKVRADSLIAAIRLASEMVENREKASA